MCIIKKLKILSLKSIFKICLKPMLWDLPNPPNLLSKFRVYQWPIQRGIMPELKEMSLKDKISGLEANTWGWHFGQKNFPWHFSNVQLNFNSNYKWSWMWMKSPILNVDLFKSNDNVFFWVMVFKCKKLKNIHKKLPVSER